MRPAAAAVAACGTWLTSCMGPWPRWVVVTRVLEEPPAADPCWQESPPPGKPGSSSPIGAVTVPPWQEGAEVSVLPRPYQDLVEVAADAGRALRAAEFAAPYRNTTKTAIE